MTLGTTDDDLQRQLETALDTADCDRVKYHLREALQLRISNRDIENGVADEPRQC